MDLSSDNSEAIIPSPSSEELRLATEIGPAGLAAIDAALLTHTRDRWMKVARVVFDAIDGQGLPVEEPYVSFYVRRLLRLAELGEVEGKGDLRRPRYSEVRRPGAENPE